jgi:hypothetical protein
MNLPKVHLHDATKEPLREERLPPLNGYHNVPIEARIRAVGFESGHRQKNAGPHMRARVNY